MKNTDRKKGTPSRPGLTSHGVCLVSIAGIWLYVGLLWLVLKYTIDFEITSVEAASFRFLVVKGLGIGFTAISCLHLLRRRRVRER